MCKRQIEYNDLKKINSEAAEAFVEFDGTLNPSIWMDESGFLFVVDSDDEKIAERFYWNGVEWIKG